MFFLIRNLLIILLLCCSILSSRAQETIAKKGWNFGAMPALAYNSDLGILYGAMVKAYDYGDGSVYPSYKQSLLLQVSAYTRGGQSHLLGYESFTLVPGLGTRAELSYRDNHAARFFGFNGYETIYKREWENPESPEYISRVFYRYAKRAFNFSLRVKDTIGSSSFMWSLGVDLTNFRCGPVDIDRLNSKKRDNEDPLPDVEGLYSRYVEWGLIKQDEKEGGWANSFHYSLVYDTRNKLSNPDYGIFTELNLRYTPCFLGAGDYHNTRLSLIHRHYISLIRKRLTFAYRLIIDYTIRGTPTFYERTRIPSYKPFDGYGGAYTLRGIMKDRLVGESMALINMELRSRLLNFRFINQNWFMGVNIFVDSGKFLMPIDMNTGNIDPSVRDAFFSEVDTEFHSSYGFAGKLAMNENFVLSAEFARVVDKRDGLNGIYLGIDYLF